MGAERALGLVDVFVQRRFDPADRRDRVLPDSARLGLCMDLHGILRQRTYVARDGRRVLCHFRAPDAESLRMAMRVAGFDYDALWTGAVSNIPGHADFVLVVERVFERPLDREEERACRASTARHLLELGAEPARVLLSRCRRRLLWLCRASTPQTVTAAEIELPGHGYVAWGCEVEPPHGHAVNSTQGCRLVTTVTPRN